MPYRMHRNANAAPAWEPKRSRLRAGRKDWIAGTLVELDPDRRLIVVRVERGGRPVPPAGAEVTVDASVARVRATDGDGDGRAGLTDLFPGDRVEVTLQPRWRRLPVATRIRQESPGAPRGGLRRVWRTA